MKESASTRASDRSGYNYTDRFYNAKAISQTDIDSDMLVVSYDPKMLTVKLSNTQTKKEQNIQSLNALMRKAGL